jgi:hypothetical protein
LCAKEKKIHKNLLGYFENHDNSLFERGIGPVLIISMQMAPNNSK